MLDANSLDSGIGADPNRSRAIIPDRINSADMTAIKMISNVGHNGSFSFAQERVSLATLWLSPANSSRTL